MSWSHSPLVAEVYDLAQPIGRSVGDVEYYRRTLAGVSGRVLEPACGTGRLLIALLEAGFAAEGVDHCPAMLDICRKHCRDRGLEPVLFTGDMATFARPDTYEAIAVTRGSIRNLEGREATSAALRCFFGSLVAGGRLLLDVTIPFVVHDPLPHVETWESGPFVYLVETVAIDYDAHLDRSMRYARYSKWEDGELVTTELHRFCFQHWNRHEFHRLLEDAGFVDVTVTADYTDDVPRSGTRYWNFSATRP